MFMSVFVPGSYDKTYVHALQFPFINVKMSRHFSCQKISIQNVKVFFHSQSVDGWRFC